MGKMCVGFVGGNYSLALSENWRHSMSSHDSDDENGGGDVGLSAETLRALREFALDKGIFVADDVVRSVRDHCEVKDRDDIFKISYKSKDGERAANFELKGIKKELGQTLNSTGLTIWRAAEHLCQFIIDRPELFRGKTICELGAGLGLVAVLIEKLGYTEDGGLLVATDGDEPTMKLLIDNKVDNDCFFESSYLYWGQHEDFLSTYPDKFEVVIAADVIYEEEQIEPLLDTVCATLRKDGQFILAFARRNVKIDKVFAAAEARGLEWRILDEHAEGIAGVEPVFGFTWKS